MKKRPFRKKAIPTMTALSLALMGALLLHVTACSTVSPPPAPKAEGGVAYQEGVAGGTIVNTVEISARVTAIKKADREVTLLAPGGETYTVTVGPEAVNFDQIRVGNLVKATVTEELVVFIDKEGSSGADGAESAVVLAPKGAKPGAVAAQVTQVTATIKKIDPASRTATLRFANGTSKVFPVRDDVDLSRYKVGEQVVFLVTEMVAISVEKK